MWLTEAAATGAGRVRAKMAEAVELARLHGDAVVDRALGQAGTSGRFAEGDLAAILSHQATALPGPAGRAGEGHTLAQGTAGWAGFGDPDLGQTGFGDRVRRDRGDPVSRTQSSRARERFTTLGADEPDQLIGVAAGELLEWGWLIGALADWLADAPDSTGADAVATEFTRSLRRAPDPRAGGMDGPAHRRTDRRVARRGSGPAMTTRTPTPPPLDDALEALLRRMRLPHIRRAAPEVLATAKAQRWDPAEVLRVLLVEEVAGRDRSSLATRRARAAFPTGKTFEAWNEATSSIPAPTQAALRTLEWIGRAENLVVCGPAGTGKTFLLEALGQAAVEAGRHVAWFTLEALGVLVRRHRADDSVTKAITRILRADLVIVDDIGLLPVGPDAAEGLYRLVDAAYERRSVAVSSNLHPSGFDELMPKTLATATVDRLLHHAHLCQTSGESVRLSQALTGAGVVALAGPR